MSGPSDRRGFLRGLATLPLIGGGVVSRLTLALAAVQPDADLVAAGDAWAAALAAFNEATGRHKAARVAY